MNRGLIACDSSISRGRSPGGAASRPCTCPTSNSQTNFAMFAGGPCGGDALHNRGQLGFVSVTFAKRHAAQFSLESGERKLRRAIAAGSLARSRLGPLRGARECPSLQSPVHAPGSPTAAAVKVRSTVRVSVAFQVGRRELRGHLARLRSTDRPTSPSAGSREAFVFEAVAKPQRPAVATRLDRNCCVSPVGLVRADGAMRAELAIVGAAVPTGAGRHAEPHVFGPGASQDVGRLRRDGSSKWFMEFLSVWVRLRAPRQAPGLGGRSRR